MFIRNLYLDQLRPLIGQPLVKLLTGVRGSGKTTILNQLVDLLLNAGIPSDHIIQINLELLESAEVNNDIRLLSHIRYRMVNPGCHFIILDEIQMVDQWELAIRELSANQDCDLYLCGSDAGRLAARLNEILPDRYAEIRVLPLSLSEYTALKSSGDPAATASLQQIAEQYIRRGGLPVITAISDETTGDQAILGLYRSILYQDVVLRNRIRDAELLGRVIRYIVTNTGKVFAVKSIGDYLISRRQRASAETLANYLRALEEAGLICRVPRFDLKTQTILHNNVKYYLADHGLLRVITGQKDRNSAGVLQNTVFLELVRRGYNVAVGKLDTLSIDFSAHKNGHHLLIQVLERRGSIEAIRKAAGPLLKCKENADLLIIARDAVEQPGLPGVSCCNLSEFLLADS